MRIKRFILILILLTISITLLSPFTQVQAVNTFVPEVDFPIYSQGAVLMDSSTGKILYGKNENDKLYPASTTKILTAIIAIENYNLTDKVTANNSAIMAIPLDRKSVV